VIESVSVQAATGPVLLLIALVTSLA
jgi:hypothetical protein